VRAPARDFGSPSIAVSAAVSLTLLAGGLVTELQNRSTHLGYGGSAVVFVLGGRAALYAVTWLSSWRFSGR
jgi:hypothetical protein